MAASPYGCIALLACLASTDATAQQRRAMPGTRMIEVDGRAVRVVSRGLADRKPGAPIVVFEAGAGNSLEVWGNILSHVAAFAPVVAYDRAGLGRSEWDNVPPTPEHVTARLRRVLRQLGATPPYVLVGYSWGGSLARYFAGDHPDDVAGIVFVDPGPIITQSPADNLAPFNAVGAGKAGYDAYWSAIAALFTRASPAVRAEFDVFRGLMDLEPEARRLRPVPGVPVVVILAAKYLPLQGIRVPYDPRAHFEADVRHRIRMLQEWALASPRGTVVISNSTTHAVPREDPDLVVWAVKRVLSP